MAAFVFDASGIVKRYVQETGTGWVRSLTDLAAGHELFLTRITRVEVTSALTRRGRGSLSAASAVAAILLQFRQNATHQYNVIQIVPSFLADAERLAEIHYLRGYDAVQLAATMHLHHERSALGLSALTLVSADSELNTAARAEGLMVDDPNSHP